MRFSSLKVFGFVLAVAVVMPAVVHAKEKPGKTSCPAINRDSLASIISAPNGVNQSLEKKEKRIGSSARR